MKVPTSNAVRVNSTGLVQLQRLVWLLLVALAAVPASAQWQALGPYGGDARSLAIDPKTPDRLYLGTAAGTLWFSDNGGAFWQRLAKLGGDHYVLDNIKVDPADPATVYVAAWSAHRHSDAGDLFYTRDGGRTWHNVAALHGKSIRALALAPSDPKVVVVGALDGVYRSGDRGSTWELISPAGHAEIRNIESLAIDPADANAIYAGTWHLPWKTTDGGRTWTQIKEGVIDDSDVFSIIVDRANAGTIYLSACSGIYKSVNSADLFRRVQGIPKSAQRTRVLLQDSGDAATIWAGTTEGLWKTTDAGATWRRVTAPNLIVNDVVVDPSRPNRVLVAADRGGVLVSNDAGQTFVTSNRGFTFRVVTSVVADPHDSRTLYAGVVNDKEFGGIIMSRDSGEHWVTFNRGLDGADVFTLERSPDGTVLAGTNRGIYLLARFGRGWQKAGAGLATQLGVAKGKRTPPQAATVSARVYALEASGETWFAGTAEGLYRSVDRGATWIQVQLGIRGEVIAVRATGNRIVAATRGAVLISLDSGLTWMGATLPPEVSLIHDAAFTADSLVLATNEGGYRSLDNGITWQHLKRGLAQTAVRSVRYDGARRLLATTAAGDLFLSTDGGGTWKTDRTGWILRAVAVDGEILFGLTAFDGLVKLPAPSQLANEPNSAKPASD